MSVGSHPAPADDPQASRARPIVPHDRALGRRPPRGGHQNPKPCNPALGRHGVVVLEGVSVRLTYPMPGSQRRAFSRKIFRRTPSGRARPRVGWPSYSIVSSPEKNAQSRSCVVLQRPRRGRGVAVAEGEVGRVEDAVLVAGQELADLVAVAAGEVADARRRVDREIGVGVEPLGQPLQVVLVAAEVAPDHAQLGVAGEHPVAGREDRLP